MSRPTAEFGNAGVPYFTGAAGCSRSPGTHRAGIRAVGALAAAAFAAAALAAAGATTAATATEPRISRSDQPLFELRGFLLSRDVASGTAARETPRNSVSEAVTSRVERQFPPPAPARLTTEPRISLSDPPLFELRGWRRSRPPPAAPRLAPLPPASGGRRRAEAVGGAIFGVRLHFGDVGAVHHSACCGSHAGRVS